MVSRMRINRKVIVGHWKIPKCCSKLIHGAGPPQGWHDWQGAKFVRFGDNMRYVAVTDGDKVEAEYKFGYSVNTTASAIW
jgi:L-arabinose isomerase